MVYPDPPRLHRSVEDMIGTSLLPDYLVGALLEQFCVTREDVGLCFTEKCSGWGLHYFLGHLASGVDPVLGFERVASL